MDILRRLGPHLRFVAGLLELIVDFWVDGKVVIEIDVKE